MAVKRSTPQPLDIQQVGLISEPLNESAVALWGAIAHVTNNVAAAIVVLRRISVLHRECPVSTG